jgi:hypothetical protein
MVQGCICLANVAAFREGLQKLGVDGGRNVRIDYLWAGGGAQSMQRFATRGFIMMVTKLLDEAARKCKH